MKTIGIVGGGQLGLMLTAAAKKLGFRVIVLDPTPKSPASSVADEQIVGDYSDKEKIKKLGKLSDYLTFEIELADASILKDLEKQGVSVNPSPETLAIVKDKLKQKKLLQKNSIPTAEFVPVIARSEVTNDEAIPTGVGESNEIASGRSVDLRNDVFNIVESFGFPFLIKARTGGYDGRGNALIKSEKDVVPALKKLKSREIYAEKFVPFVKELAVMVARSSSGEIISYPVVETTHLDNICHTVVVPADISSEISEKAKQIAMRAMELLHGTGVFGIEMFLDKSDKVLVNEIAPRVHNSGHYSIEACKTSQFEQHIRAITGMPLGSTELIVPAAAMVNILGNRNGKARPKGVEKAKKIAGVGIHLYGKIETRLNRKMGHITAVGDTTEEALEKALEARKYIII